MFTIKTGEYEWEEIIIKNLFFMLMERLMLKSLQMRLSDDKITG